MKKRVIQILSALLCSLMVFSCFAVGISAEAFTYRKAANDVSSSYKGSRFYKNLTQIQLTGDGVTDVLAVALSQIGYVEGTNETGFNGTQGGGGNYTEYTYNMGKVGSYSYAWCAAYVSWCLLQARCTDQNTQGAWCRSHEGDINYIWREVGCYRWYNQLKRFGYGHAADGKYTPKPGDLVFFETSEHIGIVRYAKNGTVYTIEGNTSKSGFNSEGGGVFCKSYSITGGSLRGFGSLPYKTNANAPKVDYSGANPTTGLWIGETNKYLYNTSSLSESDGYTVIPKGTVFQVIKIVSAKCFQVKYDGKTGYVSTQAGGGDPIYQVTSSDPSSTSGTPTEQEKETEKNTEKATDKATEAVTPNKYAISSAIKKVKDHIGSGISKVTVDNVKAEKSEKYSINPSQKLGLEGFVGFSSAIKDFGYYFDGDENNVVWGFEAKTANSSTKKKAGDKAKTFDIDADTENLANGDHTVTYVVKYGSNKTCELTTLNFCIGDDSGCADGSETSIYADGGCGGTVAVGIAFPIVALAGVMIVKKKKED